MRFDILGILLHMIYGLNFGIRFIVTDGKKMETEAEKKNENRRKKLFWYYNFVILYSDILYPYSKIHESILSKLHMNGNEETLNSYQDV